MSALGSSFLFVYILLRLVRFCFCICTFFCLLCIYRDEKHNIFLYNGNSLMLAAHQNIYSTFSSGMRKCRRYFTKHRRRRYKDEIKRCRHYQPLTGSSGKTPPPFVTGFSTRDSTTSTNKKGRGASNSRITPNSDIYISSTAEHR